MSSRLFPWFFVVAGLLIFVAFSLFTVSETEYAIRTRFGAIIDTRYRPGLHLKWPWDMVTRFDRRILSESYTGETFLTNDGRGLIVDFYVKWRVKDPALYYIAAGGREDLAGQRLAEIVKDGIKSVVAQRTLQQIVSAERAAVTGQMFGQASRNAESLGVDLVDVRVQRIDLPDEVAARVYESMKQSFAKTANRLRAEGQQESATIRSTAERQRTVIMADAERDALRIRRVGEGGHCRCKRGLIRVPQLRDHVEVRRRSPRGHDGPGFDEEVAPVVTHLRRDREDQRRMAGFVVTDEGLARQPGLALEERDRLDHLPLPPLRLVSALCAARRGRTARAPSS